MVIYSTEPGAQTEANERRGGRSGRGDRRQGGRGRGERSGRGGNRGRSGGRGPRTSSVPDRSYVAVDAADATPVAPKRSQRVDDFADLDFGKIEL